MRPDEETVTQELKPTLLPATTCQKLQLPGIRLYLPTSLSSAALDHLRDPTCPRPALTTSALPPVTPPWLSPPHTPAGLLNQPVSTTRGESKEAQEGRPAWDLRLCAVLACSSLLDLSHLLGWHPSQVQAGPPVPQESGAKSAEDEEPTA